MKINDEIRNKIKKILIHTKRLTQSSLSGDYVSAFKGTGLEFNQLREYQIGDDIRFIDWKSSARTGERGGSSNKMMIKEFVEERDRVIILAIDTSSSAFFSSQKELREDTIAQVAAAITFVATHNKDKVGALFFSDKIEKWIPPKRGRAHLGAIVETLFSIHGDKKDATKHKKTYMAEALKFLISLKKRNSIVFMLSDWIHDTAGKEDDQSIKLLRVASIKFDFVGIRILDSREQKLPSFGFIQLVDPETGDVTIVDTRKKSINNFLKTRRIEQEKVFKKYKIDLLDLDAGKPFINSMIQFFHKRIRRQI